MWRWKRPQSSLLFECGGAAPAVPSSAAADCGCCADPLTPALPRTCPLTTADAPCPTHRCLRLQVPGRPAHHRVPAQHAQRQRGHQSDCCLPRLPHGALFVFYCFPHSVLGCLAGGQGCTGGWRPLMVRWGCLAGDEGCTGGWWPSVAASGPHIAGRTLAAPALALYKQILHCIDGF